MVRREIRIPGDKSISHRAVMIGAIAKGETIVNNFLPSADCLATVECLRSLGVEIQMPNAQCRMPNECKIIIKGKGLKGLKQPKEILEVGNSGTTIRLMMGILAGQEFVSRITGDESIQRRPMMRVVKPLRLMGAGIEGENRGNQARSGNIRGEEEYAPLKISGGKLSAIEYELPVASAQVKSAVLLAGLFADGETTVIEKAASRDHTERLLSYFGASIKVAGQRSQVAGQKEFRGCEVDVPGDISSAAFFLVAGLIALNSELIIYNVGVNPTRTGILDVLHRMSANIEVVDERIICGEPRANLQIRKTEKLKAVKLSGEIIPRIIDEIPIIALAATQAEGTTEIRGAKELRIKESDRIAAICSELKKLGANIQELEDGMIIKGPTKLQTPDSSLRSYGDHRIAMMLSIAGLAAEGKLEIDDTSCIETSFPGFKERLAEISS